jgi:hypothetical protein
MLIRPTGAGISCLRFFLGVLTISCTSRDSSANAIDSGQGRVPVLTFALCEPSRTDLLGLPTWTRVEAKVAPISLLLPRSARAFKVEGEGTTPGETWRAGDLTVLYRLRQRSPVDTSHSSNLEDYKVCADSIGGRPVTIVSYYSNATTVPGTSVFAVWAWPNGQELTVYAHARDRLVADTLLALVRAVRFR